MTDREHSAWVELASLVVIAAAVALPVLVIAGFLWGAL